MFQPADIPVTQIVLPILPEIGLLILLLVVLSLDLFIPRDRRRNVGMVAGIGMLIVMLVSVVVGFATVNSDPAFSQRVLGGMLRYDVMAVMFRWMVLLAGGLTCLIALDVPHVGRHGEFHAIVIVATMGMSLMSAAADLIMVFLALETTSISLYVLAGFLRENQQSSEAGLKYFLFGSFTAGLFLYGLSLVYGLTGNTSLYSLAGPLGKVMGSGPAGAFAIIICLLLLLAGFGFKVASVPFHFWTPDVYQGAPTPVTAFISTASKAASFALLVRVFSAIWPTEAIVFWTGLLAAIAAVTMTLGNVLALVQKNIKRLIAYSSIAQAGYTLIGVVALSQTNQGIAAVVFYMFMYVLTNIAAFTVIIAVSNAVGSDDIKDFAMLSRRSPYLALAMVLALLSLGGVPPLAGFFGKFFVFAAAVQAGYVWLAVLGVLNAIVGLYYYLTVIKVMYVDPNEDVSPIKVSQSSTAVLWLTCGGMIFLGTLASPIWNAALNAATSVAQLAH